MKRRENESLSEFRERSLRQMVRWMIVTTICLVIAVGASVYAIYKHS